jgi:hypothetical protein
MKGGALNGTAFLELYLTPVNRKGLSLRRSGLQWNLQRLSGKVREPSPNILFKLAALFDVPYETLLSLAGYPLPTSVPTIWQPGWDPYPVKKRIAWRSIWTSSV